MSTEVELRKRATVWSRTWEDRSLVEVFRSVPVAHSGSHWKKSQAILSRQLPFAVMPLILISGARHKMQDMAAPRWLTLLSLAMATTIIGLNVLLL
ncbi:hypothetical protein BH10PSE8_BH10PSE8_01550 [soil metagenome]